MSAISAEPFKFPAPLMQTNREVTLNPGRRGVAVFPRGGKLAYRDDVARTLKEVRDRFSSAITLEGCEAFE